MVKKDECGRLYLNINPYLKWAISIMLMSFLGWLVLQIDSIRDTYPSKFVYASTYQADKACFETDLNNIKTDFKTEQQVQREFTQKEFDSLRTEMNQGFKDTRELILKLHNY